VVASLLAPALAAAQEAPEPGPAQEAPAAQEAVPAQEAPAAFDAADAAVQSPQTIRYVVERIEVAGNRRTKDGAVKRFVPLEPGDVLDVDDPAIEAIRWQLLGTGWFDEVRLRLERGSKRGLVVLIVEVQERNTIVIEQLIFGVSEGVNNSRAPDSQIVPYGGFSVAETNLLGTGMSLSLTGLFSQPQQGVRLRFTDPTAFGSKYLLSSSAFFTNAKQFFGRDPLVSFRCDLPPEECPSVEDIRRAVVFYRRAGLTLGTGHDLGASTRYTLDWQGEWVNARAMPEAASTKFGTEVRPIDFAIEQGRSWVSLIRFGLDYDRATTRACPPRGCWPGSRGTGPPGSSAATMTSCGCRCSFAPGIRLPDDNFVPHYLRMGVYGGVIFGEAPFFYKFHVSDLTDLIPSRVLEMELDSRQPPNLLDTSIAVMRAQDIAGRVDVEYGVHVWRGTGALPDGEPVRRRGHVRPGELRRREHRGPRLLRCIPVARGPHVRRGLRLDTTIGVFQFGFSTLLGFIAL
jgi:outer membrane protein insertion porin family